MNNFKKIIDNAKKKKTSFFFNNLEKVVDFYWSKWLKTRETGYDVRVKNADDIKVNLDGIEQIKGQKGNKGDKGDEGETGKEGKKGDKGDKGETGKEGKKGDKGDKGETGREGKKGDKGDKGEKGEEGKKGSKPKHKWKGTKLSFEKPDGVWGKFVDLQGADVEKQEPATFWGGGVRQFIDLVDTPTSFSGEASKLAQVKADESGLEFVTPQSIENVNWGEIQGTLSDQIDLQIALNLKANSADLATVAISGDHTDLTGIGTNTHIQIDAHLDDGTIHFLEESIDHGSIAGLGDDDHPQYPLLAGRNGESLAIDQVKAYDSAGLKLYDDGGNGIFVKDGGNVGIGTTSPDSKLDVGSTGDSAGVIASFRASGFSTRLDHGTIASTAHLYTGGAVANLSLGTNSLQRLTILANGNIGIGTTAPTEKLDVNSDAIRIRTSQTPATSGSSGNQGNICWDSSYLYIAIGTNTWKRAALSTW